MRLLSLLLVSVSLSVFAQAPAPADANYERSKAQIVRLKKTEFYQTLVDAGFKPAPAVQFEKTTTVTTKDKTASLHSSRWDLTFTRLQAGQPQTVLASFVFAEGREDVPFMITFDSEKTIAILEKSLAFSEKDVELALKLLNPKELSIVTDPDGTVVPTDSSELVKYTLAGTLEAQPRNGGMPVHVMRLVYNYSLKGTPIAQESFGFGRVNGKDWERETLPPGVIETRRFRNNGTVLEKKVYRR